MEYMSVQFFIIGSLHEENYKTTCANLLYSKVQKA